MIPHSIRHLSVCLNVYINKYVISCRLNVNSEWGLRQWQVIADECTFSKSTFQCEPISRHVFVYLVPYGCNTETQTSATFFNLTKLESVSARVDTMGGCLVLQPSQTDRTRWNLHFHFSVRWLGTQVRRRVTDVWLEILRFRDSRFSWWMSPSCRYDAVRIGWRYAYNGKHLVNLSVYNKFKFKKSLVSIPRRGWCEALHFLVEGH